MHSRPPGVYLLVFTGLAVALIVDVGLPLSDLLSTPASAESVPFNCRILPGQEMASILMTNSLSADASCIVTWKFQTTKHDNNPQITCAKPVPAGKQVEMCLLTSGGDKMVKLTEGHAECTKQIEPRNTGAQKSPG
jgi:hypothetical protein